MTDYYDGSGYDATTVKFFDVAHEGAQVRAVAEAAPRLATLRELTARSVIVLTTDHVSTVAAQAVVQLRSPVRQPVVVTPTLPHYTGALDIVIAITDRGDDPALAQALITADKRGAATIFAGPSRGPIREDVPEATMQVDPLPTAMGISPARAMMVVNTVLDVLEEDEVLVAARLRSLADELDEEAAQCSPERDSLVNPARQLRDLLGQARILHTGASPAGDVAAQISAAVFTTRGLAAAYVPLAEYQDAADVAAPVDDIFYDPFIDGPPELVALKSIVWGAEESTPEITGAQSVPLEASAAGPTGQALRMIVRGMAVTIFDTSAGQ